MCLSHGTIDQPIIFKLEMNDVRLGVWRIPYLFRDVQGLLLVSAQNTEYKRHPLALCHNNQQVAEFLLMKANF